MKKQKLLGQIIKSPVKNDMIKGPFYTLKIEQTKLVVDYLQTVNHWTEDYLDENALIIPNDILFRYLKIFPLEFRDDNYLYDFHIVGVDDYFGKMDNQYFSDQNDFLLASYSKKSGRKINEICLGYYTKEILIETFEKQIKDGQSIEIDKHHIDIFLGREDVKDFYDFDFKKYNYVLERFNTKDYVFNNTEEWWNMEELYFTPFTYINN